MVSVMCLTMNHAPFTKNSFSRLVNQTFRDFEILYLDNNSHDDSFAIADKILSESGLPYKSFRRTESHGIAHNLNLLLSQAQGKYIAALCGDDFWELNNLEERVNFFEAHPEYGMIYGSGHKYYYDVQKAVLMDGSEWKSGWVLKDLLSGNFINAVGYVIRKSVLDEVGAFDEHSLLEDWDLWIRIAEKYPIGFLDKPLVYYGQRTGNNTSSNTDYMDKGAEYIFKKYAQHREIRYARKKYWLYRVYERASDTPSFRNFKFILKHFQFNRVYFRQLFKFLLRAATGKKDTIYPPKTLAEAC